MNLTPIEYFSILYTGQSAKKCNLKIPTMIESLADSLNYIK